jgi:hypothetical protein
VPKKRTTIHTDVYERKELWVSIKQSDTGQFDFATLLIKGGNLIVELSLAQLKDLVSIMGEIKDDLPEED